MLNKETRYWIECDNKACSKEETSSQETFITASEAQQAAFDAGWVKERFQKAGFTFGVTQWLCKDCQVPKQGVLL